MIANEKNAKITFYYIIFFDCTSLMEREELVPKERVYVCTNCFGKLVTFMLTNPNLLKSWSLPTSTLTAYPVEDGIVKLCQKCNDNIATGFIPLLPSRE